MTKESMRELQCLADRVCVLILSSDLPSTSRSNKQGSRTLPRTFPDQEQLYEMIYESRFQRLWEQFRGEG